VAAEVRKIQAREQLVIDAIMTGVAPREMPAVTI
jgi:hypothetical protein